MTNSKLQFISFRVNRLSFESNSGYKGKKEIPIQPEFKIDTFKAETNNDNSDNVYKIVLRCNVFEKIDAPFKVNTEVEGVFKAEDDKDAELLIKYNAVAVILPYVRSIITQLTTIAERNPLRIPIINVVSLYEENNTEKLTKVNPENHELQGP